VRVDLEAALNQIVPEKWHKEFFTHTLEGPDDMTGHVKSSLMGASVSVPVTNGRFNLGELSAMAPSECWQQLL
jgi:thiamine phosphate synthase YjbQ (UPF0047 family)